MAVITGGHVIEGAGLGDPLLNAGAPVSGTNEVQTLTIGGTPTGGTFKLTFDGFTTAAITWSATNSTLLANINAALDALPNGGTSAIVATANSLTAGIGTISLTFSGAPLQKKAVNTITIGDNSLTGTSPTLAVVEATPGVDATYRSAPTGAMLIDITNAFSYINTSTTALAPTWTKTGTQS